MRRPLIIRMLCFLTPALLLAGCGEGILGDEEENLAPETYTIVKNIQRVGEGRFVSQIDVQWWGDDPDGVVKGFELSSDQVNWTYTTRQDSTFLVQLPEGADTFDFDFYVRAIDKFDKPDPTPAYLVYPVKNSRPEVAFDIPVGTPTNPGRWPDKTFPILQLQWLLSDPDGDANIDYLEFYINDTMGTGIQVSKDYRSLTIEALDPEADQSDCRVLLGSVLEPHEETIGTLDLNAQNVFYIRATDKVGAKSNFVASKPIFIKKKVSDVLLVNAYESSLDDREKFYIDNLLAAGITSFDTIRVNEVNGEFYTQLAVDNVTQSRIFAMFDVLIWFGEDAPYTLTLAQRTTGDFLDKGGRMFASVFFNAGIDPLSNYLEFTPIDSLVAPDKGVFFMDNGAAAKPSQDGWPELRSTRILTSTRPFQPTFDTKPLYEADLTTVSGAWEGPSVIMAKREVAGETQFIISSIELYRLDGNNNMKELFEKVFKEELGL